MKETGVNIFFFKPDVKKNQCYVENMDIIVSLGSSMLCYEMKIFTSLFFQSTNLKQKISP